MLDGINVLNTIEMHKEFPMWTILTIGLLFGVGIGLIGCFDFKKNIVGIILCISGFLVYGVNINLQLSGEYEYQVTIDESVSMVDFTSKYDIVRVDGEIYTIREKESE